METKINQAIKSVLLIFGEKYFIDDVINKQKVIQDLDNYDKDLISKMLLNDIVKSNFTMSINDAIIFNVNKLIELFETNEYWQDSYTKYSKKIGLTVKGKFLDEAMEVVLNFPYKDTVLKAGMTKEDLAKDDLRPDEPFLNEVIAKEEIDVLLDKKLFVNAKKYDVEGEHAVSEITEDDNLILKGNNLLALHSLKERYAGKVKLIYIDPPYNTGSDSFRYNDKFNRSTWLTFMKNRLEMARDLLTDDGVVFIHCDDNEQAYLKVLMDEIFGAENFIANVPTIMNLKGNQDEYGFAGIHEYMLVFTKNKDNSKLYDLPIDDPDEIEQWEQDSVGYFKKGANLKATGVNAPREKRPNLYFPVYISSDGEISLEKVDDSDFELYPITDGKEMSWRWQYSTMEKYIDDIIVTENNGNYSIYKKQRPELGDLPTKRPKSVFYKPTYSSGNGTNQIRKLFDERIFNYPKPEELIRDVIEIGSREGDIVLDFFMGSATTQAVAHKMNRQYIGIEQMDYINTVSVPRLQKVIEGEQGGISKEVDWQGGGSLIYAELMEKNTGFLKEIIEADTMQKLQAIFERMSQSPDIDFRVDLEEVRATLWERSLEEQKKTLIKILDKNQLYFNYSEIDDAHVRELVSDSDYAFNQSFYKEVNQDG
ncbi:DNA methyltransferase [Vagococcus fluvialis]|uniref:DNA methyltransferase n=1 Tax=Vagococcus fluvialis TaxID=2738 RepID=UPI002B2A740B|nr:site-specific DNA-methyltransferase [Vagococcus fluvialis]